MISHSPTVARFLGTVTWFDPSINYGFVRFDLNADGSKPPDIFAHYSGIRGAGWRNLVKEDRVEFTIISGRKGPQADDIVILTPTHEAPAALISPVKETV